MLFRSCLDYLALEYVVSEGYTVFADEALIDSGAKEVVQIVNKLGVLVGKGDSKMDPKGKVTRAELATILRRLVDVINKLR